MSEQQRILVVDDEPPARARLVAMVGQLSGYTVCAEAGNGEQAVELSASEQPDIVLMDIRMPGVDGLQAAEELASQPQPPAVIFCTAYDEHALAAFRANAQAYLLKPVRREELQNALESAQRLNRAQLSQVASSSETGDATLLVKHRDSEERIRVAEIRALIADHKYVSAYLPDRELLIDESLKSLEQRFGDQFIRVHRNALVAPAYIEALEKSAEAEGEAAQPRLRLQGVDIAPQVSRRLLPAVRKVMKSP